MAVTWDGDRAVHDCADEGPNEARHALRYASKELERERHAVDVWAVVGDDGEGKNDEAELSEATQVGNEDGSEKSANAR